MPQHRDLIRTQKQDQTPVTVRGTVSTSDPSAETAANTAEGQLTETERLHNTMICILDKLEEIRFELELIRS